MIEAKKRSQVQVKFRLPVETHKTLSAIAAARGQSLSKTIRGAMCAYVKEAKGKGE